MALTVRTNTAAHFAQDALRSNQSKISTAMERLSTGLRINSAKDDAAGLAIGNKMTSQIKGFSQALRNIQDGISLLQTADGALDSISNLLQRMRELTIQASTDTYSDEQRSFLHLEAMQVQAEIERIKESTTWNGKKILDGTFIDQKLQIGANSEEIFPFSIAGAGLTQIGLVGSINSSPAGGITESAEINFSELKIGQSITIAGLKFTAERAISASEVANAYSNLQVGATSGNGSGYGEYNGVFKKFSTATSNNNTVIATSTIPDFNVSDIEISSSGTENLQLPALVTAQGNAAIVGQGSVNSVKFSPLMPSQSVTVGGLKFTANKYLTAQEVALEFSNINGGLSPLPPSNNGYFSGGLSWAYDSKNASGDEVIFQSRIHNMGSPILIRSDGINALNLPSTTTIQGEPLYSGNPEVAQIEFADLQPNQTVTIRNNNRWLAFTATEFLTATQVATIFSNRQSNNYFAYSSSHGYFQTVGDPFSTGPANGKFVTFTSNYIMPAPISASYALGVGGSTANIPQPTVVEITSGAYPTGATEKNTLSFHDMAAGQWISIGGLQFTASKYLTGAEVAAVFADLSPNDMTGSASISQGVYSGIFSADFSTSLVTQATNTKLSAVSTSEYTNVTDLAILGSAAVDAPTLPTNTFTQGISDILARTESNTIGFPPMQIGQSLEIAGLKFTATSSLNSNEVASAFSNLSSLQNSFQASIQR